VLSAADGAGLTGACEYAKPEAREDTVNINRYFWTTRRIFGLKVTKTFAINTVGYAKVTLSKA
jgi:hypothetical protein